jgi:hypothetical protein
MNEDNVLKLFYTFLEDANLNDPVSMVMHECKAADLSDTDMQYVWHLLAPTLAFRFAEHCLISDGGDLNRLFENFCLIEGLDESNLANAIAVTNNSSDQDDPGEINDDGGSEQIVFSVDDWKTMDDQERFNRLQTFLKKLKSYGAYAANLKPFLTKSLKIGEMPNPWGVEVVDGVKTFDRASSHFGHGQSESTIQLPNIFNQGHDSDHRHHDLMPVLKGYNYRYVSTTPVAQPNGDVWHSHLWQNHMGHQVSAYHHDNAWSSRVGPSSSQVFSGIGTKKLDDHLKSRAKRYKIQEETRSVEVERVSVVFMKRVLA